METDRITYTFFETTAQVFCLFVFNRVSQNRVCCLASFSKNFNTGLE